MLCKFGNYLVSPQIGNNGKVREIDLDVCFAISIFVKNNFVGNYILRQ